MRIINVVKSVWAAVDALLEVELDLGSREIAVRVLNKTSFLWAK